MHWKTTAPYVYDVWMDGQQIFALTPGNQCSLQYIIFGIVNWSGCNPGTSIDNRFGSFVGSSAQLYSSCVVEVGNAATYATATKVRQPLTAISDSRVDCICDLSGLGSGPYYLWVTNNRQQRSVAYSLAG
jgi:hypothetical protein